MGVDLEPILIKHKTSISDFAGNTVSVDAYNIIYQFLSGIRQPDGTPLMDRNGNVTSHLSGLFYRTVSLISEGLKPVFVFDGKPSPMKMKTLTERKLIREKNEMSLEKAIMEGDSERIARLKRSINSITSEMVEESITLLKYMGIPFVKAPSEGEAQASYMSMKGDVQAVITQDYDSILFGARRVLRNFAIYGKRRVSSRNIYVTVDPEYIDLRENLSNLGITREQLVDVAILVGTDFNDGVRNIGPKKALDFIKKYEKLENVIKEKNLEVPEYEKVRDIFLKPQVTDSYNVSYNKPDEEGILMFLCEKKDFSENRVRPYISKLQEAYAKGDQKSLDSFF